VYENQLIIEGDKLQAIEEEIDSIEYQITTRQQKYDYNVMNETCSEYELSRMRFDIARLHSNLANACTARDVQNNKLNDVAEKLQAAETACQEWLDKVKDRHGINL